MTKVAIFDLDGTLLDSMGVWDQVDIDFLGKRGIEVPPDYMIKVSSMQFQQIAEYTIARFGLKDTPEELMQEWDDMARVAYSTTVEAKPGALDYLRDLKSAGVKMGVATSLPPQLREPACDMSACSTCSMTSSPSMTPMMSARTSLTYICSPPSGWAPSPLIARCLKTCWSVSNQPSRSV